jgi:predicted transcriptional regulator
MHTIAKPFLTLTAQDLMSRDLVLLPQELSLRAAARWLAQDHISGAPVVDEAGRCVGVLSATDFVRHTEKEEEPGRPSCNLTTTVFHGWQMVDMEILPTEQVRNYMTPNPITVALTTPIVEVARTMLEAHIHRLVVVDHEHQPIGIVTATDVLAAVARTDRKDLENLESAWAVVH